MGKKSIIALLLGFFGVYVLGGFFGVPYLITHVIPPKVSEATDGGEFGVQSASFNPFVWELTLQNVSFKTPQSSDFITINKFYINLNPVEYIWKQGWVIEDLQIINPAFTIAKDAQGVMNFEWLMSKDENETAESSEPLALLIRHFTFKGGKFSYSDVSEGRSYHQKIDEVGFNLDNIDLRDMSTSRGTLRLYATINEGGFIDLRGKIASLEPFMINGKLAFDSGKLYTPWRYVAEKMPIRVRDGVMNLGFDYAINADDLNATRLSNFTFGLDRLRISPKEGDETLASLGSLRLKDATIWPIKKQLEAKGVTCDGVSLGAKRFQNGEIDWLVYLDEINAAFPDDENETKEPWNYRIGGIDVQNVAFLWSDYAPKVPYKKELTGIHVKAEDLSSDEAQPINASIHFGAMSMHRLNNNAPVSSVQGMEILGLQLLRQSKKINVSEVSINGLKIGLKRLKNGKIDLIDEYLYVPKTASTASSSPWQYDIARVMLNDSEIHLVDEVPSKAVVVDLSQFNLGIENLSSDLNRPNTISLESRINQKSSLKYNGSLIQSNLTSSGTFALKGVDVTPFDPYLEPSTYASLKRGFLSLEGTYRYEKKALALKGKLGLDDWVVNDSRDQSVLVGWESIGVTPFVYNYPDNRLKINQLDMNGLYANTMIDPKKVLNFSTLSKAPKELNATTPQPGNPFGVDIIKFVVKDGSTNFSDLSLPLPFKTYIHDLNGQILGISTTKDVVTYLNLTGGVDQYGLAKIGGKLNTKDPKNYSDVTVRFDNLDLKQYTPYSLEFLGYKIDGGKLYLDLGYKIDHGKLNSQNKVVIKQIVLGEEKAGGSSWPMRLVVALLEDSEGVIDIDLPIEGDVNNPDFKYGKLVWQVIGNLLTKAVTSPFKFLGSLMGLESQDSSLSTIGFEAGSADLLPPEREKLDKLSGVLVKRPKLSLTVHGGWDKEPDDRALRLKKLVAMIMGQEGKKSTADALGIEYLENSAKKEFGRSAINDLRDELEKKYPKESDFIQHYSEVLIEKLVEKQRIAPPEIEALAQQRTQSILRYLEQNSALSGRINMGESEKSTLDDKHIVATRLELKVK